MSKTQQLLKRIVDAWHDERFSEDYFLGAMRALESIPEAFHDDVLDAIFKPATQEKNERPVDYAAVRTFDSEKFNVGDEVTDGEYVGIVTMTTEELSVVMKDGSCGYWDARAWNRTGRNFPAVAAILNALKK